VRDEAQGRRNRPPNRWGCKPIEDVCVAHDDALACRHGCELARAHQCSDRNRSLVDDLCKAVASAGGVMTLHGKPVDAAGLKAAAEESVVIRLSAAVTALPDPADHRCHCDSYRSPPQADETELRIHGTHTCIVFVEKGTGDLEAHTVLDDGGGDLYVTFCDNEREAAQDLIAEVRKLRAEASASRALLNELLREIFDDGRTADLHRRVREHLRSK
jgi:hypothetical protein